MENFIKRLEIDNFKSIRHLELSELKRINLFIGRPNVGKSNILEALSCFCIPKLKEPLKLNDLIRVGNGVEIFYDGKFENAVKITIRGNENFEFCQTNIQFDRNKGRLGFNFSGTDNSTPSNHYVFDENNILTTYWEEKEFFYNIKKYTFTITKHKEFKGIPFLCPPFGENLEYVLELLPELRKTYAHWFSQYGLKLVLDRASHSVKILKEKGDEVFILPYSSIADTLQRIIFYKTAVASNENSVLIFEEPEAHSFPPYIVEFTQEVIKSKTNQFFIATHSQIVVNDFLENAIDDLGIFMVDFKDGQTVVRTLTKEEIQEVYKYGVDLFFNNEAYSA